ncbi:nucleotidyltransferase [Mucilaginibacter sp. PAMC 26640]|nr:nucleotidyltransferase [Mucilaginibacter sp. PAMC 26640]
MQLSAKDINTISNYFKSQPVLKAYLFGSYSRNEANKSSDVDILVDLDYTAHIGLGFVTMQSDLENKLQRPVDLISSGGVSPHLNPFIDKDKVLIYER